MKYSEKKEFIKEWWSLGDPTFKLRRVSWGPTFKLWMGSQIPFPRVLRSHVPGSWYHFYTMPTFLTWRMLIFSLRNMFWAHFWRIVSKLAHILHTFWIIYRYPLNFKIQNQNFGGDFMWNFKFLFKILNVLIEVLNQKVPVKLT